MADSFFSTDGQERTRALKNAEASLGEFLNYYLGPTGISDRLVGTSRAVEAVSPVSGTLSSMTNAGRAADPRLSKDERVQAGLQSLVDAGLVAAPTALVGRAAQLNRLSSGLPPSSSAGVQALEEAFLGTGIFRDAQQEVFDRGRRNFLVGSGAALLASRLPGEDLMLNTGRYLDEAAAPAARLPKILSGLSKRLENARTKWDQFDGAKWDILSDRASELAPDTDVSGIVDRIASPEDVDQYKWLTGGADAERLKNLSLDALDADAEPGRYFLQELPTLSAVKPEDLADAGDLRGMENAFRKAVESMPDRVSGAESGKSQVEALIRFQGKLNEAADILRKRGEKIPFFFPVNMAKLDALAAASSQK